MSSSVRGSFCAGAVAIGGDSCTPASRNSSPRRVSSASTRCSTLRPNSRSLSTAMARAWGSWLRGVGLELDALLEVDEVKLDFVGRIPHRQVGDDACAAASILPEPVLPAIRACWATPTPEPQRLQARGAGLADGHAQSLLGTHATRTVVRASGRCSAKGTSTRLASLAALPTRSIRRVSDFFVRRRIDAQRELLEDGIVPGERAVLVHADGRCGRSISSMREPGGQRLAQCRAG